MGNKENRMWNKALPPVVTVALLLALWEGYTLLYKPEKWMLPAPTTVVNRLWGDVHLLLPAVGSTLGLIGLGLGLGIGLGVAAALLFHLVPLLKAAFAPVIVISQNVPIVAVGPLLIVWFGFGVTPKLILLVLVCFFPITLSMLTGLARSEPALREYLAMIGASRLALLRRLELPASLPYFFTGLKITATYSVSTAVVVEWLGGDKGIGKYMLLKKASYDAAGVFASVVWVVALSLALYGAAALLEKVVVRWKPQTERKGA